MIHGADYIIIIIVWRGAQSVSVGKHEGKYFNVEPNAAPIYTLS